MKPLKNQHRKPKYGNFVRELYRCENCRTVFGNEEVYRMHLCTKTDIAVKWLKATPILTEEAMANDFITKDSGKRQEFSTGMKRDVQEGKPRYDLVDRPMLKRWAELMERGARKYGENNWKKAETVEELHRFEASLLRHVFQLIEGDRTEDHGAAICFNAAGREMVWAKLNEKSAN